MMNNLRLRCATLTALILVSVSALIAQTAKPVLVALNKGDSTLAIIDPGAMKILSKVPTGDSPHEVVLSTDGKTAFVANYGAQTPGSSISMIDVASAKETRRIDVSPLQRPHGMVFLGGKLYFTSETNRIIGRYDPAANKIDWLMGTGQNGSHMIVATADQKHFYTTNVGNDSITAFDLQGVPPSGSRITHIPVGKQPEGIGLSPDGKEVWVGLNVDLGIDIVDTATSKVVDRIKLGERPYRVAFTPDGKRAIAPIPNTKELAVIDSATRKEIRRIKLDGAPLGLVITADGKTAFVTMVQPDVVIKVDIEKGEVTGRVQTGTAPDGIALFGV